LSNLVNSPLVKKNLPALYDAISIMGSPQIRNRASITGNICNASPAADSAPPLYVHKAEVIIKTLHETKVLPINEFFLGPKINCLKPNELLTEIRIPIPRRKSSSSFQRIGRRKAFTLSIVNAATYLEMESKKCIDARIALGSVASTPKRVQEVEEILKNRELTPELINEASELSKECVMPITDIRGTADYRKDMCKVLVKRTIYHSLSRQGVTI
jgi:carbon-monoxide dehydrogenase medium subunit